jgi:glutathione S-transferase
MSGLILHHFDWSPFAEKARLVLGLKRATWQSVQIPMIPPKPDLMPLTGGYRKTPTLQIGADIYCDTRLIATELDRRLPAPPLFPGGNRGVSLALSQWSDTSLFEPGAILSMTVNKDLPEPLLADRRQLFTFMTPEHDNAAVPHLLSQLRVNAALLDGQLADGRAFLLGDAPGWADLTCYFVLWMARAFLPSAAGVLAGFKRLDGWVARVAAIGHGERSDIDAAVALEVASQSTPDPGRGVDRDDPLGLDAGEWVSVTPTDYGKTPVVGELITLDLSEVAVRREDARVGTVVTHFPRAGYRVERARAHSSQNAPNAGS